MIFGGHGISTFDTEFEKHSLKIFISSYLSDTTFALTISDIFSSVNFLSARHGFTVSQNYFLSVTDLTSRLLKKYFRILRSTLTQIFRSLYTLYVII